MRAWTPGKSDAHRWPPPTRLLLPLTLLAAITACSDDDGPAAEPCSPTDPRTTPLSVGVLPDDGEAPYLAVLDRATTTLRVFSYLMGRGGILDRLKAKAAAGVDVRVILDQGHTANGKYFTELEQAGVDVRWSDDFFTHMHAKVIIADEQQAVISTGNYSLKYAIESSRDFTARTVDPDDLADLVTLFDADWQRQQPDLSCTRLLVAPVNARARILELIAGGSSSITVESMQLADAEVREALAERRAAGVEIRVLLADPGWVETNADAATFLAGEGIPARWMSDPGVHAKAVVVDGARAYLGSINLSYTSLSRNREVGVISADAAAVQRLTSTFEHDWGGAAPF